jgi:AcrR family transcriptional regulator
MASTAALHEPNEVPRATLAPNRRDRRTARTRQAIIDASRELIEEQGFAHTTVDQIAERADIAPRTFFRYFASKEAVLFAQFEEHRRLMLQEMADRPGDEHPFRSVVEGLVAFCAVVERERERFAWAFQVMREQELVVEQTILKAETCDRIAEFVAGRLGVDGNDDPRPHSWAMVAMTLFGNACKRALEPPGAGDPERCFRTLLRQTAEALSEATPAHHS